MNTSADSWRLVICVLILNVLIATFAAFSVTGCSQVPIKNNEFFVDMGEEGAFAFYSLTPEKQRDISKEDWDDLRFGMYAFSADTMANLKAAIKSLCSITNACDYQYGEMITQFFNAADQAQARANRLKKQKQILLLNQRI